jgi:hypothetical protein
MRRLAPRFLLAQKNDKALQILGGNSREVITVHIVAKSPDAPYDMSNRLCAIAFGPGVKDIPFHGTF